MMGRMVPVDEWAKIHGKTHATVMRKIYANAWPQAQKVYQDGKTVWMLDEVWLCHQHHNEPGFLAHYNATVALELKAAAQEKYEEKNGPGAHAAWMAAVGKDYLNA